MKRITVKDNIICKKETFLVKHLVLAAMKNEICRFYVHLRQFVSAIIYMKGTCRTKSGGCCKHVHASLYQLIENRQNDFKLVLDDRTCTDSSRVMLLRKDKIKNR